jgi:hypothetical protein
MTTYYVRRLLDFFPQNVNNGGLSEMQYFEAYNSPMRVRDTFDRIFANSIGPQKVFYFADTSENLNPPTFSTMTVDQIIVEAMQSTPVVNWGDQNGTGWNASRWSTVYGWNNPDSNYSGWLTQICTKFDTLNKESVVSNNSTINVLVFSYRFANYTAGLFAYFPVFYVGDDPNADTTVTI